MKRERTTFFATVNDERLEGNGRLPNSVLPGSKFSILNLAFSEEKKWVGMFVVHSESFPTNE